jgi:hypothetical protein
MNDESRSDIDPRFDPAFQRGFDPRMAGIERGSRPLAAAPVSTRPPVSPTVPVSSPTPVIPVAEEAADSSLDSHPGRNPFLLSLAVVAVILVALGVWLFVQSGAQFNSRQVRSQGDYMSLDATIHLAPFISLLGVATAIGVVFVFAGKWRSRQ